jgi:hypothetical protein
MTLRAELRKNNVAVTISQNLIYYNSDFNQSSTLVDVIYMNGTTDYLEVYVWQNQAIAFSILGTSSQTYFTAFMSGGDPNGQIGPEGPAGPATGIGYSQTWQNVTGSRALGTTYTNSTSKPIMVNVSVAVQGSSTLARAYVGEVEVARAYSPDCCGVPQINFFPLSFIVPAGSTYYCTGRTFAYWSELR